MNSAQTDPMIPIDPVAFAHWVHKVAAINEHFSEVIRDTADIVALHDPAAAIGLYQAADTANTTVHRLRCSMPIPLRQPPAVPLQQPVKMPPIRPRGWLILGFMAGMLAHLVTRL